MLLYWVRNEWGDNRLLKKPGMSKKIEAILEEVDMNKHEFDTYFGFLSLYQKKICGHNTFTTSDDVANFLKDYINIGNYIVILQQCDNYFSFAHMNVMNSLFLRLFKIKEMNIENEVCKKALIKRKEKNDIFKVISNKSNLIKSITTDEVILNRKEFNKILNKEIKKILKNKAFKVKKDIRMVVC